DLDQYLVTASEGFLDGGPGHPPSPVEPTRAPAAGVGLAIVAAVGARLGRRAQPHLTLEFGDLFNLAADFLFEPAVDLVVLRDCRGSFAALRVRQVPLLAKIVVVLLLVEPGANRIWFVPEVELAVDLVASVDGFGAVLQAFRRSRWELVVLEVGL